MARSRWIAVAVLAAFACIYVLAGSWLAIPVFGLQLVYLWRRTPSLWLLAVQTGLVYTTTIAFGTSVGILGFLAGSLLLTRLWPLAPLVLLSGAVISKNADSTISLALIALLIYGLTRLTQRVEEVRAARLALAMAAVAEERLRIAAELNDGLGRGLTEITRGSRVALAAPARTAEVLAQVVTTARQSLADARAAAASYRAMSLAPEVTTARAMLAAAGVTAEVRTGHTEPLGPAGALLANVLREAVTDVVRRSTARTCTIETSETTGTVRLRVTNDGVRTADDESLGDLPAQVAAAGGALTTSLSPEGRFTIDAVLPHAAAPARPLSSRDHTLSVALLATVVVGFCVKALLTVPANLFLLALACQAVIIFIQLRSVSGRHMWSLALMTALTYLPVLALGRSWLGTAGFLAGPLLLAFPPAIAWPLVVLVMASVAWMGVALELPLAQTINYTASTLVTGLVIYGLMRLAQTVKELDEAREELARSAVVEERLRAARDLHDLLGHSLAAILLKCELARRLDPERARAELQDVLEMAARAEADVRAVSGDAHELSLTAEADSARSVLAAAGIDVSLDLAHDPLPPEAETVLATVLREAVTNILRHSTARTCTISTVRDESGVRLRVRNNGARASGGRRGSAGIGNLTTRLAVLDGRLSTSYADDWFELTAWTPNTLALV